MKEQDIENLMKANEALQEEKLRLTKELNATKNLMKATGEDYRISQVDEEKTNKENEMLKHRANLLEKQLIEAAKAVDTIVPVLFGSRLGQKELMDDPFFNAFKQIRKSVEIKELGTPRVMSTDYKPAFYG